MRQREEEEVEKGQDEGTEKIVSFFCFLHSAHCSVAQNACTFQSISVHALLCIHVYI